MTSEEQLSRPVHHRSLTVLKHLGLERKFTKTLTSASSPHAIYKPSYGPPITCASRMPSNSTIRPRLIAHHLGTYDDVKDYNLAISRILAEYHA